MEATTAGRRIAEEARASFAMVLPSIGAIYLALGVLYLFAPPLTPGWPYAVSSFVIGTIQLLLGGWIRVAPLRAMHGIGFTAALLAVGYALSFVILTGDPAQTVVVVMVLLGAAFVLLTYWTTLTITSVTLVAWFAIARDYPTHDLVHWGVNLVGTAALALVISIARVRSLRRQIAIEQALRESEERHRLVVDTALDAVITVDTDGVVRGWNPQAEQIFGWPAADIIGRPVAASLLATDDRIAYEHGMRDFLATGESTTLNRLMEVTAITREGRTFTAEMTTVPIRRGDGYVLTAFLRDITARKLGEDDLRRAKEDAEAGARVKADFLATMSHEIRTPLNGIFGMTELALDTEDDGERREFLERARACADSLMTILNDVLDFSRVEAGRLDLERIAFDPRDVVDGVLDTLALEADRKGLELIGRVDARLPARLIGDPGRLRQILINLGGNAIKFTERGEVVIELDLDATPTPDGSDTAETVMVRGRVRDTGIGIDPESQRTIFDAFTQADSSMTRRFGGTGLGLAICQRLVGLMHGTIGVTSTPGSGSEFWFTTRQGREAGAAPAPTDELAGRRVLVVSANGASADHVGHILQTAGAASAVVATVAAADAAIRTEAARTYDAVIVDLPASGWREDGWCLGTRTRVLDGPPRVVLASNAARAELQRSGDVRDHLLSKPIKSRALLTTLAGVTAAETGREARRVAGSA